MFLDVSLLIVSLLVIVLLHLQIVNVEEDLLLQYLEMIIWHIKSMEINRTKNRNWICRDYGGKCKWF